MKKLLFATSLLFTFLGTQAQDYLSGKLVDKQSVQKEILYDRTQNDISLNVYQTVYKIANLDKKLLYSVTLTHDRIKGILFIGIKPQDGEATGRTVSYDRTQCGLIFSDATAMDSSFNVGSDYTHLFSFTDTIRTYPVLHKLKTNDKNELILDPLTKLRIRKHKELIKNVVLPEQQNAFNQHLFKLRDSLYAQHFLFNELVSEQRQQIEEDITILMKDKQVEQDVKRYEGEKRFGNPHGKGLMVLNGNIYDGNFAEGKFVSGNAILHSAEDEYCGQFKNDSKAGTGWLKYPNGSYFLGTFADNKFINGVALQKGKDGEIYFGGYNGKRNSYGELQNSNGGKYAGEFLNDRLVRGYAKEVDPFGYYTYARIEKGNKIPVDAKTAEEFFGLTLSAAK